MNTYLIYGSDYSLVKREVNNIIGTTLDVTFYDLSERKIDELLDDASCISLFEDKKILIGENANFLTSLPSNVNHDIEYLQKYVNDNNHNNIVILTVIKDKLDERKKIVKTLKNKITVIKKETINDKDLPGFVISEFKNKGFLIDSKSANYFVDFVGKNVDILISEIQKMIIYKQNDNKIDINDINLISSKGFKDNIFDLTDAIMKRDFKKIFECYNDLVKTGEDEIKIIALLSAQFALILSSKILSNKGKTNIQIAEDLNVHPYRVKLALETNFLISELKQIIKQLHNLDFKIKSGKIDKRIGLEDFFLHI